jgi:hypothetical protein
MPFKSATKRRNYMRQYMKRWRAGQPRPPSPHARLVEAMQENERLRAELERLKLESRRSKAGAS